VPGVEHEVAEALARAWARAGELEHASIAAFIDLADDLRAHGAPDGLVERCEIAAGQERDHTSRCFALASRYAGRQVRSGPMRTLGRRTRSHAPALTVLAGESIRDGIVNEGVAALLAAEQQKLCSNALAAETLAVIARDEALHAELGWSILEWCVEAGGDDVRRCIATTGAGLEVVRPPAAPTDVPTAVADAHGRGVPPGLAAEIEALHDAVLRRLDAMVAPGTEALAR
jgi:hypothetical protein